MKISVYRIRGTLLYDFKPFQPLDRTYFALSLPFKIRCLLQVEPFRVESYVPFYYPCHKRYFRFVGGISKGFSLSQQTIFCLIVVRILSLLST